MAPKVPHFSSEEEEAAYWEAHSVTDHLDELELVADDIKVTAPRQGKKPINIRVDEDALYAIREIVENTRIPYQTLIRSWLIERLKKDYPETLVKYSRRTRKPGEP